MRTSELKKRLGITSKRNRWYERLLRSGCIQTGRPLGSSREYLSWNDRDANWLIRLYERCPKKTGYFRTHLITKHYQYGSLPYRFTRALNHYRGTDRCVDDQWRDMIQGTAIRVRTYQIILNTLLKDATKAGYEPLGSWTDTSYYDKLERKRIIVDTRRMEPSE